MNVMHQEKQVFWKNGLFEGEGLYCPSAGDSGVVICHPHPLMGGSMHNNVVETVRDVFASAGFAALRFNFRGVGGSTGSYDEGRGERQDILSACEFMKNQSVKEITLVGYSFGAWICCLLLADKREMLESVILISPPQKYFDFNWNFNNNAVKLIICGDNDMFCDVNDLKEKAEVIHSKLIVMKATDHFYAGKEDKLAEHLRQYIHEKKA